MKQAKQGRSLGAVIFVVARRVDSMGIESRVLATRSWEQDGVGQMEGGGSQL